MTSPLFEIVSPITMSMSPVVVVEIPRRGVAIHGLFLQREHRDRGKTCTRLVSFGRNAGPVRSTDLAGPIRSPVCAARVVQALHSPG
jgi:hypothetical protein